VAPRIPPQPERPPPVYRNDLWTDRPAYPESAPVYDRERESSFYGGGSSGQIAQLQAAATGRRSDTKTPIEINHAINYVNKIKVYIRGVVYLHSDSIRREARYL